MWMAVNEPGGTAGKVKMPDIEVAAKTGTAQTIDNGKKSNNSWVISFAPYENPKYAICVLVQNGGSGGARLRPARQSDLSRTLRPRTTASNCRSSPRPKFAGNTDRIEKAIEILPEMIAAVEAGEPPRRKPSPPPHPDPATDDPGETGDEVGEHRHRHRNPPADNSVTPTPTLTPEIDDEGTVIPRAVPVPEP